MPIDPITARIHAFAKELSDLVRAAALDAVEATLRPASAAAAPVVRAASPAKPPRRRGRTAKRKSAPAAPAARPTAQLGALDAAAIAYVKTHPGLRCEEIAAALKVPSPQLKLRIALLIESKKLRKTGQTRGTKYFAV